MNKLKLALMIIGLGAMTSFVGSQLATMQNRSTESNQTNQNNSNQNRNQNRNSNRSSNGNSNRSGNMNSSMNGNMNSNMMDSNSMMNSGSMNSNMSSTMTSDTNALDADFARMAAMGGMAEVRWAEVAQQRSTSKEVKKYASRMIKDHTKANNNLMKVAAKKSMTLPTTMSDDQMQILSQLQAASGAEFDRMYLEMSGVQAHQMMATLFQNQATNGTDADLKSFAAKTLPTVQMHLQMAQQMANGGTSSGGSMNGSMNDSMNSSMNSNSMSSNSNSNSNSKRKSKSNSNSSSNSNSNSNSNR